jgi:hypothetical protein
MAGLGEIFEYNLFANVCCFFCFEEIEFNDENFIY